MRDHLSELDRLCFFSLSFHSGICVFMLLGSWWVSACVNTLSELDSLLYDYFLSVGELVFLFVCFSFFVSCRSKALVLQ